MNQKSLNQKAKDEKTKNQKIIDVNLDYISFAIGSRAGKKHIIMMDIDEATFDDVVNIASELICDYHFSDFLLPQNKLYDLPVILL